jgi:hypothetical protein
MAKPHHHRLPSDTPKDSVDTPRNSVADDHGYESEREDLDDDGDYDLNEDGKNVLMRFFLNTNGFTYNEK